MRAGRAPTARKESRRPRASEAGGHIAVLRLRATGITTDRTRPPPINFAIPILARRLLAHVDNRPHPYTRWGAASSSRSSSPAAVCPRGDIYTPSAAPSDDLCRLTEVFTQFPHASLKGDARAETTLRSCGSRCRCGDCIKCRTLQTLAISHFLSPSGGKAGLSMADICSCVPI